MSRPRGRCQLACGEQGAQVIAGFFLCVSCVQRIRAIARAAGVVIDESLVGGALRKLNRRALTKAEKNLEDEMERREIDAARRSA
jgi:hypothetical protein